ncbi:MAG: ABC transporter permease [Chthoniobacterales bacterium]|nr:ABC transporter permease [Chthoniobacterales bacterium]
MREFRKRLWRDWKFRVSVVVLLGLLISSSVGMELMDKAAGEPGPMQQSPPTMEHWFGTDLNGRDLLYRLLVGLRVSFLVGLAGAGVSFLVGTTYGLIAGWFGGWIDNLMMRIVDILYSVPRLVFLLILIHSFSEQVGELGAALGWSWLQRWGKVMILVLGLGLTEWLTMARIVRGQVLSLKWRAFVEAARATGAGVGLILIRHILPNLGGVILASLSLTVPSVILDETFLSFLGLGVEAPLASLGTLLADGAAAINPIRSRWWLLFFPAAALVLLLFSLYTIADCFRDALAKPLLAEKKVNKKKF